MIGNDDFPPATQLDAPTARVVEFPPPLLSGQLFELPELPELKLLDFSPYRPPLHVVSADLAHSVDGSPYLYSVRCTCGWDGAEVLPASGSEDEILDRLAEYWRAHVRLSERVWRRSKKFRAVPGEQVNTAGGW